MYATAPDTKSGKQSRETVYVITDLTSRQASPERIVKILRAHWVIENRLHFVRDTAFREDASKIRNTRSTDFAIALGNNQVQWHGDGRWQPVPRSTSGPTSSGITTPAGSV
ncbi:DDE family transposase [Streptomyces sp. Ag109_O5-1]|uniref:transposase n=1 Tax=Streptomyces sp. Ag109_O5-1 TaxID=1938851 RepID=UPI000F4EAF53|nr:DDE family transposase [Streptomyces sp. Ag109_O5-1]